MSDWDGPDPSDSGVSRRALLAGLGGAALLGGGAVAFGPSLLDGDGETVASVSESGIGADRVDLEADVPLRGVAELTDPPGPDAEVGIEVSHADTGDVVLSAAGTERASDTGTTATAGTHNVLVVASGAFEATVSRRSSGLF